MRQLEYLEAAVAAPTWAQAAATLGVTPSALSQGLAELERRLGVELFARAGRRRLPTQHAAVVLVHAQRVLAQTRDLARWAGEVGAGRSGQLRVGMVDVAAVHHHPDALRAFRSQRPEIALHLAVDSSAPLLAQLRAGALDLVVCVAPPTSAPDLDVEDLVRDDLCVYAPAGARVGPPATWGPWVMFPEGAHTRAVIFDALRSLGAPSEVIAESHQPEVLAAMVRLDVGWTVLPAVQAEHGDQPLVRARAKPIARRSLVVARRADAIADPAADALVALLRDPPAART